MMTWEELNLGVSLANSSGGFIHIESSTSFTETIKGYFLNDSGILMVAIPGDGFFMLTRTETLELVRVLAEALVVIEELP